MKVPSTGKISKMVAAGAFAFAAVMVGTFLWNSARKRSAFVQKVDNKIAAGV